MLQCNRTGKLVSGCVRTCKVITTRADLLHVHAALPVQFDTRATIFKRRRLYEIPIRSLRSLVHHCLHVANATQKNQ